MKTEPPSSPLEVWFQPGRFAAFLAILFFANFPGLFLGTHTFYFRDYLPIVFPYAQYNHDCFWRGELPLWNPLNHCGAPYLAQWQTFVLYPGWWIFLPFPPSWSLGMFTLAHWFMAGLTMYWLAHSWTRNRLAACVAGLAYCFNGLTQNSATWPHIMGVLAWAPAVVLLTERAAANGGKAILWAGLAGAMQMLLGAPEQLVFTWCIVVAVIAARCFQGAVPWKPAVLRLAAVVLLVSALAAAQLLPFVDLLAHSQRHAGFAGTAGAMPVGRSWSVPGWGWADLFVPLFYNFQTPAGVFFQSNQYCTSSYYLGIGVLALGIWGCWRGDVRARIMGAVFLAAAVLALGENGYLYDWAKAVFPGIGFMRYPVKFMFLSMMVAPLLAAIGTACIQSTPANRWHAERWRLVALAASCLAVIAFAVWFAAAYPLYPALEKYWPLVRQSGASRAALLALTLGALVSLRMAAFPRKQSVVALAVLALVWLDLQTQTSPPINPVAPRWALNPGMVKLDPRPQPGESRAFVTLPTQLRLLRFSSPDPVKDIAWSRLGLLYQSNLIDGIPEVGGAHTLLPRGAAEATDLLNVTNSVVPKALADFLGISQLSDPDTLDWKPRDSCLPMVTAGQTPVFADEHASLAGLMSPAFDPRRTVFLPKEAEPPVSPGPRGPARIFQYKFSPRRIRFDVESETGAWVVVAQSYYHWWRASVDGRPTRLWRANHGFQALEAPAGRHEVRLVYEDRLFVAGAVISLLTLAGWIAIWLTAAVRRRRARPEAISHA